MRGARGAVPAALLFVVLAGALPVLSGCSPRPVAVVNGEALSEKEFARLCETATQVQPGRGTVGMQVLIHWIRNTMLAQEARKLGVYPSEEDLQKRLDSVKKQMAMNGTSLDETLKMQSLPFEVFKQALLDSMIGENVMYREVAVTDADVKNAFEEQSQNFVQPARVKISQITVDSPERVKEVQNDLAGATRFELVAQTRSKDGFAQNGGIVPAWLERPAPPGGPVAPEVVETAFKLKPGQVSDPIKVGATWVFVRLEEKEDAKRPKLEDVGELIRSGLRISRGQKDPQKVGKTMMDIISRADIKINRPEYQMLVDQMKSVAGAPSPAGAPAPGG